MPAERRLIRATIFEGAPVIGAVSTPNGVLAAFPKSASANALNGLKRIETGRGNLAYVPSGALDNVASPELDIFENKRVLLALRNGETAQAAAEWVRYHSETCAVGAALIFDRAPPESADFADGLMGLLENDPCTALVVQADTPLGRKDAPDARDPALAPAMRGDATKVASNPWHAPLSELTLYELLRYRFLAHARAIALLDISDFLLPSIPSVFDQAAQSRGKAISLQGTEVYPWRLRQAQAALFGDHIAARRGERRRLLSWCAAPSRMPDDCVWQPGRPAGAPAADHSAPFVRAMGVIYPGISVDRLVKKSELREVPQLIELAQKRGHKPIRLPAAAPIPKRPENGSIAIVSVMKNEGPFVLDWIAHNRAIGVDRFLIYTNDCSDGTDHLLDLLGDAGVTRRDNPFRLTQQTPQYAAFSAAEREEVVTSADWLLTLDVDEYINIHAGEGRLTDLLNAAPKAHVISMPWRLFGNADQHAFLDRPVADQFTMAAPKFMPRPYQAWAFKTLYRNAGIFKRLGVHRPKGVQGRAQDSVSWVTGSGKEFPPEVWRSAWRVGTAHWGYDLVTLNHYAVRSAESFMIKRDRGRVNHVHELQDEAYWFRMNHNVEEDTSIKRLARRVAAAKAELTALPGVAEAHANAVAWHQNRITELKVVPEMRVFYENITSPRMEKLSRLGPHFSMTVFMEGPHVVPDKVLEREPGGKFHFTLNHPKPTK